MERKEEEYTRERLQRVFLTERDVSEACKKAKELLIGRMEKGTAGVKYRCRAGEMTEEILFSASMLLKEAGYGFDYESSLSDSEISCCPEYLSAAVLELIYSSVGYRGINIRAFENSGYMIICSGKECPAGFLKNVAALHEGGVFHIDGEGGKRKTALYIKKNSAEGLPVYIHYDFTDHILSRTSPVKIWLWDIIKS